MADRFPLIANPSTSTIQEIPSGDTLDLTGNNIKGAGIITATTFSGNLTGSVTGNAGGLTGTPNIVVGTLGCGNVTSTGDVTVTGNLTVQGTTTTIDTAVTDVDSLNVEGNVGIGLTNPFGKLQVRVGTDANFSFTTGGGESSLELINDAGSANVPLNVRASEYKIKIGGTERVRITSNGSIQNYYNTNLPVTDSRPILQLGYSVIGDDNSGRNGVTCNAYPVSGDGTWHYIGSGSLGASRHELGFGEHKFYTAAAGTRGNDITWSERLHINSAGNVTATGTISDSIGPLRRLGIQGASGGFSLAADMAGKLIRSTGNGSTLTIPQNVFSAGDMISIFNVSTGDNTIAQGTGATLYNTGDGATGNRTLAAKGVCTIVCTSTNEFIISGSGLS